MYRPYLEEDSDGCHVIMLFSGAQTDLEEAAQVMQGALGPQETPGENGTDLLTHSVEMGNEAVRHLSHREEVTPVTSALLQFIKNVVEAVGLHVPSCVVSSASSLTNSWMPPPVKHMQINHQWKAK